MKKFKKPAALFITIICLLCVTLSGCSKSNNNNNSDSNTEQESTKSANPSDAAFINEEMKSTLNKLSRVDEDGYLYELTYDYDYYDSTIQDTVALISQLDAGCSAFTTFNTEGDFILARNYDYNHLDADDNPSGLNLVLRTAPEGKLKSIAVCDAWWLNPGTYTRGAFDDGETDISNIMIAPYLCVDGMNEAGVSIALLAADTKEGEVPTNQNTGKDKVIHSVLLRYILDNAKSLEEAIDIAKQYDVMSSASQDIHIIISDKDGNTAVLEWRQFGNDTEQKLYVTYTNAVTNFLVGFDDAQDMYHEDGSLRERVTLVAGLTNTYHYGYGHGYHRFAGIVSAIDRYISADSKPTENGVYNSTMMNSQAYNILSVAAQEPGLEKTSLTQYSALYDMTTGNLGICLERDYTKEYSFSINE